jgi:4-alpha-glucanotransferase
MPRSLESLARSFGVTSTYQDFAGHSVKVPSETLHQILGAMNADPASEARAGVRPEELRKHLRGRPKSPEDAACYLPDFLSEERVWGVTCQLYSLRTHRSLGIGDFEDLARLGETVAGYGADFLGVNPLHALFLGDPAAASPFSPSDRNFLNPLYIAVDKAPCFERESDANDSAGDRFGEGDIIDYPAVALEKMRILRRLHRRARSVGTSDDERGFVRRSGDSLHRFAVFEALSIQMSAADSGAGWFRWPPQFTDPDSAAVAAFEKRAAAEIDFQKWLQWVADSQLAEVARRLADAGMRIGLYLDVAVGAARDGAATWRDRSLCVSQAAIGAPPDMFNLEGQDWGIAPLAPSELVARNFAPLRGTWRATMRHAGAVRIDHAMSLYRLFWIPAGKNAKEGAYVIYPMEEQIAALAEVSQECRAIVIGEDLGLVPRGFRKEMARASMMGYRIFYFERKANRFVVPSRWPEDALACVGSHDTATLAGWWSGSDIDTFESIGLYPRAHAAAMRKTREREREQAIAMLAREGRKVGSTFDSTIAAAVHRHVAATPSRLMAVQLEDLLGLYNQANVPGTVHEHPNWRRRMPVTVEELTSSPTASAVLEAVARERPRLR